MVSVKAAPGDESLNEQIAASLERLGYTPRSELWQIPGYPIRRPRRTGCSYRATGEGLARRALGKSIASAIDVDADAVEGCEPWASAFSRMRTASSS